MSPKIINKEQKRIEILFSALKVMSQKGLSKTKMVDIAHEAGIGKGTIYEYFKSKDEIFHAGYDYFMNEMNVILVSHMALIHDPVEKLEAFFDAWGKIFESEYIEILEVMLDFWAEGLRKDHGEHIMELNKIYDEYRLMLQNLLDDCIAHSRFKPVNTHITASIIIGALDGLMLQWIIDKSIFNVKEAINHLKTMTVEGLTRD